MNRCCRFLSIVSLVSATACGSPQHPAVGDWRATDGSLSLRLLGNGTGSFGPRSCTWQELDNASVLTDCERLLFGRAVRKFTVTASNGQEIASLENYPGVQLVRTDPSAGQEPSEGGATPTAEETWDLPATWIGNNEATQALGGQMLVAASNTSEEAATLRITLPDTSVVTIDNMRPGTRKLINIEGVEFYLDLLDAGPVMGAQVSLTRKR